MATIPDDARITPAEALAEAQRLLAAGRPFHAHEVLEAAWKVAPDGERGLWRGLAQLAVGLTHLARGNAVGAATLLRRGAGHLGPYAGAGPHRVDAGGLRRWATALAGDVDRAAAGDAPPARVRIPNLVPTNLSTDPAASSTVDPAGALTTDAAGRSIVDPAGNSSPDSTGD